LVCIVGVGIFLVTDVVDDILKYFKDVGKHTRAVINGDSDVSGGVDKLLEKTAATGEILTSPRFLVE
jgi:hypothetical protein